MWSEMRHHHAHVVLDEQDGDLLLVADRVEQLVQPVALARVEAGRRLVEAEQHGPRAHGARDLEPPLVAVGQVAGGLVGARDTSPTRSSQCARSSTACLLGAGETAEPENGADGEARGAHQPVVLRDHQILQHRHAGEQADVLEGAGDARPRR